MTGRIESCRNEAYWETLQYDAAANLLDRRRGEEESNQNLIRFNQLLSFRGLKYSYDEHGRTRSKQTASGTQYYHYDAEHRLTEVRIEQLNHTERYGYVYDALGRRIEKHRLDRDGKPCNRTTFLWDGLQMIQESSADKRQSLYLYTDEGSYEPLARIDRNGNQEQHIYYFHTDLNGMPEELTDEAGEIVWECSYQLWGKPIQEIAHTEIQQNLRYQGQYLDRETGLHYNTFRYYDLDIGRFTQPDPIGLLGGLNLYQYAPNGLTWIDPWGLTTEKIKLDPNEILVNPKDVNFSQKTINSAFDTPEGKRNIQSVINDVRKGNVKVTDFPAIRVVDVKGQLVVRDGNSRLAIARSAKAKQIKIVIETNVNELKDFKRRLWRNNMPNTGTSKVPTCK